MLITFSIENFLSFKERHTFSMVAGMGGRNKAHHLIKKTSKKDVNLVKTAVLYGANASGKSNLVKAIHFGQQLLLKGTVANNLLDFQPFKLDKKNLKRPSRIEFEIKHKGRCYAYGFLFDKHQIQGEWLYVIDNKRSKPIFERDHNQFDLQPLQARNSTKQAQFLEFIAMGTPENQLFLTEISHRNVQEHVTAIDDLLQVIDWFQNTLTIWYPHSKTPGLEFELHQSERLTTMYKEFLSYFDTGIDGISLEEIEMDQTELPEHVKENVKNSLLHRSSDKTTAIIDNPVKNIRYFFSKNEYDEISVCKLMTKHRIAGTDNEVSYFDIHEESDGTQRIMDFIPMLVDLLAGDNVFIVDEMERSLHPNLIYELLELFLEHSTDISSQLILASHATALLTQDLLRKDEIWFVKKDQAGASSIYSLEEYNIRFDKKIRKDYLIGRYQAIPKFGNPYKLSAVVPSNISDDVQAVPHEV
ncbi:MAG: AAA family ATPase [Aureispira sp.]